MILAHLFRDFSFELAEPTKSEPEETYLGNNSLGTLGPVDTLIEPDVRPDGTARARLGCYLHAIPRSSR